jgi:hypoxanthine phosphoribosyltransferase
VTGRRLTDSRALAEHRLRPLLSAEQIALRVGELAAEVSRDYAGRIPVLVCVLKGSFIFTADLVRALSIPVKIEFLGVQSYGDDTISSGVVQITQDLTRPIRGEDVVIVEDIVDTGLTLAYIFDQLRARDPQSIKVCALLHKPVKRPVAIDYLGFTIDAGFVVGYGLDRAQVYRNLPYIAVLESS